MDGSNGKAHRVSSGPCVIGCQLSLSSLKCPVSAHWKCLASTQRDEVLRAARERDRQALQSSSDPDILQQPIVRRELKFDQITEFLCGKLLLLTVIYC